MEQQTAGARTRRAPRRFDRHTLCLDVLHGFQLGPGTGAVMAELIVTGHTNTPLEGLGIARFSKEVPESVSL